MNKYGAIKVTTEDGTFDSKAEFARWCELQILLSAGEISELTRQPEFVILDAFTDNQGKRERSVKYTPDFRYLENGHIIIEDCKSEPTRKSRDYQIRRKLFKLKYPELIFRESE